MQQMQENYASKKQKHASASNATDVNGPCARKRNDRIDSICHATHATQALALCALHAFEWKPGFRLIAETDAHSVGDSHPSCYIYSKHGQVSNIYTIMLEHADGTMFFCPLST